MITKKTIKNGFEKGVISIEDDYAGCLGACCRIGDNAFYFIDAEDAYLTKEEYWKSYTLNMTINMIFNVLKNVEAAEEEKAADIPEAAVNSERDQDSKETTEEPQNL